MSRKIQWGLAVLLCKVTGEFAQQEALNVPALTTPSVVSMFAAAAAAVGPCTVFCQLPHLALPRMSFPPAGTLPRFSHVSFHFLLFDKRQLDWCVSLCLQNPSFKWIHELGGNKKIHCLKTCASFLLGKTWSRQRLCSDARLCLTLCSPVDCIMPGSSVLHCLLELAQTRVHWVSDAIRVGGTHSLLP